jgi:multidrug efflux pump subunit AcrA (membrane-fusion protein)
MKIGKKQYWIIGIIVITIGAGYYFFKIKGNQTTNTEPQTTTVSYGTLVTSVSGSGSLAAQTIAGITAPGYGIVDKVFIKNGDTVTTGQALFHFKSLASATDVAKARASYLSSQASLINARQQAQDALANEQILKNNLNASKLAFQAAQVDAKKSVKDAQKTIVDAMDATVNNNLDILSAQTGEAIAKLGLTSAQLKARQSVITAQSNLSTAQRDATSASLKAQSAQVSLTSSQASATAAALSFQELTNQTVTAPIAGQVVNMALEVGSIVGTSQSSSSTSSSSSSSTSSGTSVLSIFNPSNLSVTVAITEVDIPNIKVNAPATLTFDSLPNKTFAGHVINMDTIGTTTSDVTTYNAEVQLEDIDSAMRPGMSASASIITNRKDHVLLVPVGAVKTSSNGQATVTVMKNGIATPTDVTTGLSNDLETEIVSGLNYGDVITLGTTTTSGTSGSNSSSSLFGGNNRGGGGAGAIRAFGG